MSAAGGANTTHLMVEVRTLRRALTQPMARRERALVHAPLLLVLALQALAGVALLRNTPFQDEALYTFAGHDIWLSITGAATAPSNYASYFSGYPYLYPVLAAFLNHFGGIETVRWFSTVCMLVTTTCVYLVSRRIFNQASGLMAACLFACQGTTLLLERLATFDALALMLLAVATVLAVQVADAHDPVGALLIAPVLILAVGVKYAALIFVPFVIGLMALRTAARQPWWRVALNLALTLLGVAILVFSLSHVIDQNAFHGLSATTTQRTVLISKSSDWLAQITLSLGGPLWALSLFGFAFAPKRLRLIALTLLLASAAAPAYHFHTGEATSLQKHIGYALFFVAPLAGYAVAEMTSRITPSRLDPRWLAGLMICLVMFTVGANDALWWYRSWPQTSALQSTMLDIVRPGSDRYLCEDYDVLRYELSDATTGGQFVSLDFFQFTDAQGHQLIGDDAYKAAIAEGYFNVVELNFDHSTLSRDLETQLEAQPQYELVAVIPYSSSFGAYHYMIWRKRGA